MKALKTLVITHAETDRRVFQQVADRFPLLQYRFETDVEKAIDAMQNGGFELLIVEKNLGAADLQKLNRLSGILFPDAAMITIRLSDEDFLVFKLSELIAKWQEAQSEGRTRFLDNPPGF